MPSYDQPFLREGALGQPVERADARAVFGQVMGLVAVTVGFFAAGAYIGRDLSRGTGLVLFIGTIGCIIGLNVASRRSERLAIVFLFGLGLFFGLALGPVLAYYASSDPAILWQSGGATALSVAALGSYGYATSRDLSSWGRALFWSLLALIVLGIVLIFVSIPGGHIIYAVAGLVVFGLLTVFDFNRLRRANMDQSVPIAASIFLDVVNIFLFFITLFGGGDRR
jgi:FtsH-binding integral membrane protein